MCPEKFYSKYIIKSYFISSFYLSNLSDIPKIRDIKLKLLFTSIAKLNCINGVLSFSILTKTRPKLINSLKNYKENRVDISGLNFTINKNKFLFLGELLSDFFPDNRDSFIRLKKEPIFSNNISFYKFLDSIYVDKIYEISCLVRNSQQIKFKIFFNFTSSNPLYNTFLFNIWVSDKFIPKPLL